MGTLLPEKIYNHLRRKLLAGEVHAGTRLDYKKISSEMGVSTTPVREAMGKLASEGLVELVPRAGAIVRKLGEEEAVHLYGVREAIETYAAARAANMISESALNHLELLLDRMRRLIDEACPPGKNVMTGESLAEFLEADLTFHMTIIEAAGNPKLTKLAGDSHIHARIFGLERFGHERGLLEEADQIHHSIYQALKARDGIKASQLLGVHISRSLDLTLAHIKKASWWRNHSANSTTFQPGLHHPGR
ncbi:MAG TPA: GntR family transcriptional regulator [Verrucomicrobiota bacterium]|nr:GntR family transcriptional regulator [Verrucomicrobiota bacterium]